MAKFFVEVERSISVTVEVEADTVDGALDQVNRRDFELPPRDEWTGHKDWSYVVRDADGEELASADELGREYALTEDQARCRACQHPIGEPLDSPGVLVHLDQDGIDYDQDADHAPVPE